MTYGTPGREVVLSRARSLDAYRRECEGSGIREVHVGVVASPADKGFDYRRQFVVLQGETSHGRVITHLHYAGARDPVSGYFLDSGENLVDKADLGRKLGEEVRRGLGGLERKAGLLTPKEAVLTAVEEAAKRVDLSNIGQL